MTGTGKRHEGQDMSKPARKGRKPSVVARVLAAAALTALPTGVFAQSVGSQPGKPPLDVNSILPEKTLPPPPEAKPAGGEASKAAPAGASIGELLGIDKLVGDGPVFDVSRFIVQYRTPHPDHPAIEELLDARVTLGVTDSGYVFPREGMPSVDIRVGDVMEGVSQKFHFTALVAVQRAVVESLRSSGLIAVWAQFDPEELAMDPATGQVEDLRGGEHTTLQVIMWTGRIAEVRTLATGERLGSGSATRINPDDRVHLRIREQSPVQSGDLLWRDEIDDFVFRLNRHPGRRVDVAVAAASGDAENLEQTGVDYLVSENKPWSVYFQLSNTGTKATDEWRQRFGFTNNQLTGNDDVLRLDYITSSFDAANAVTGSYEFPAFAERLRGRVYGSYSEFNASDVGQAGAEFDGRTWVLGGELSWNFFQHGATFIDFFGGARWQNIRVNDRTVGETGKDDFFIPYLGARLERATDRDVTFAAVSLEGNVGDLADTSREPLNQVGRRQADDTWVVLKGDISHSFFLDPLFDLSVPSWRDRSDPSKRFRPLAHEIALSVRGQFAFDYRLIANEQDVAGGLYSVRGYDESIAAGDNVIIGSAEYRFHIPRIFGISDPGYFRDKPMGLFGPNFRWTPQSDYGVADWDLIARGFIDGARTVNNNKLVGENDLTLIGTGVGIELQWKRNVSLRLDWGFALHDVNDNGQTTEVGDNRVHFSMTVLY